MRLIATGGLTVKTDWNAYRNRLRADIEREREFIQWVKDGAQFSRKRDGEPRQDITGELVHRAESAIATLQAVLDKVARDHLHLGEIDASEKSDSAPSEK